ncbi:MAG TPA: FAD-binding oxidoreductase [Candidatus Limnocylindrales bacterium]|nr:FAD-binding oxidoreductase [Candidatus Limnocylindrales bacterium]
MAFPDPFATLERRVYWQATMPPLPDRRSDPLPDEVEVAVVGGGYTGVAASRELARRGVAGCLLEARRLGWGASTRNGGIVHPGYKWGPHALVRRYGLELAGELYRESVAACRFVEELIRDEGIDCDWVGGGLLELAAAPGHVRGLEADREALRDLGEDAELVSGDRLRAEIDSPAYRVGLALRPAGGLHPGKYFAGLVGAALRAGAVLREEAPVRRIRRDGRGFVLETGRGSLRAREVLVATDGYTDRAVPSLRRRVVPVGSYMIATEPLPPELASGLAPTGRVFFDTKNFLYYWRPTADGRLAFGGRASFVPTSVERTARVLYRGMTEVYPQLRGVRIEYAWGGRLGFTVDRMPHVGRIGGLTYALGYCGSGVALGTYLGARTAAWLCGEERPVIGRLRFPLVPVPYEGRPWFLPIVGEWFRLQDRLAARGRP